MENVLIFLISVQFVLLFGIIIFLWYQFNSTDSRLVKLIKGKIDLERISHDQDHVLSIGDLEEDNSLN
jgi:hypothetical protein